jgi:2-haloacid dehalogenase
MADFTNVRALAFDVFGTVVDWRGGIAREAEAIVGPKGHARDWGAFANAWRQQILPAMGPVRSGERVYMTMDALHRETLDVALAEFEITDLDQTEKHRLAMGWRRLDPWPDSIEGMSLLKAKHAVVALSNGNIALVLAMAKRAGLPWDTILGADLVRTYKPDAAIYDSASRFLDIAPAQVMMVACHPGDLDAAKSRGLMTAYVHRPLEWGPGTERELPKAGTYDVSVHSFTELAEVMGA